MTRPNSPAGLSDRSGRITQSSDAGEPARAASHRPGAGALGSLQSERPRTPAAGSQAPPRATCLPGELFDPAAKDALKQAPKIWVFEYSSTGGGHTARGLEPMVRATQTAGAQQHADPDDHAEQSLEVAVTAVRRNVINRDEVIAINLPPKWKHDKGNAKRTLDHYIKQLEDAGVKVMLTQGDKTITGLYQESGASNNAAMLQDFVDKPKRFNAGPPMAMSIPKEERVPAFSAKDIMAQMVQVVGPENAGKINVLSDMGVYTPKAALQAGVPADNVTEIGNHQALMQHEFKVGPQGGAHADPEQPKSKAFLAKASGGSTAQRLALIEYSTENNTVTPLPKTFSALGITPETSIQAARIRAAQEVLDKGRMIGLAPDDEVRAGVITNLKKGEHDKVETAVYLYLNEYTAGAAQHIKQRIRENHPDYRNSMFVLCGAGAVSGANAMHVMYAGVADGITAGGFGTTSEMHYMMSNGNPSRFLVMPVENQHEQQANAAMLQALLPGRIQVARGPDSLRQQIDALVAGSTRTAGLHDKGTMGPLVAAAQSTRSNVDHIVDVMADKNNMTPREKDVLATLHAYATPADSKAMRRLTKLIVPALAAIIDEKPDLQIQATSKVPPSTLSGIAAVKAVLEDAQGSRALLGVDCSGPEAAAFRQECAAMLEAVQQAPPQERIALAKQQMEALGQRFVLGW